MWFDDLIGFFSPGRKLNRLKARFLSDEITHHWNKRKYEGASSSRRTEGWVTPSTSANAEVQNSLFRLRNRSRDLVRNNPYAARAIQLIASNVIGKGIIAQFRSDQAGVEADLDRLWQSWAETTEIDWDGLHNFFGLQRLIMRSVAESGEVLIRRRRVRRSDQTTFPIKLQVLESDFIATNQLVREATTGNRIIQGIELDDRDRRVAYHLFESHPGNFGVDSLKGTSFRSVRVPASEILHIFRVDRPGQIRGVPWAAPVIIKLRDFDEFEDAQLVRQKIASCFSLFIHDLEAPEKFTSSLDKDVLGEKVEPGLIEILPPGKDIKFANPPGVTGYGEYTSVILHSIAAGYGISYESLTGNLSEVNFSSARMGWLEMSRNIDSWRAHIIKPMLCDPVFKWFLNTAALLGVNTRGATVSWTPPRREMIDPTKEVPAKIKAVRAGIETLSDVVRQNGKHPREHFAEIKIDNDILDSLGLVLDTDPRRVNGQGAIQEQIQATQ